MAGIPKEDACGVIIIGAGRARTRPRRVRPEGGGHPLGPGPGGGGGHDPGARGPRGGPDGPGQAWASPSVVGLGVGTPPPSNAVTPVAACIATYYCSMSAASYSSASCVPLGGKRQGGTTAIPVTSTYGFGASCPKITSVKSESAARSSEADIEAWHCDQEDRRDTDRPNRHGHRRDQSGGRASHGATSGLLTLRPLLIHAWKARKSGWDTARHDRRRTAAPDRHL
jgi:hypothetical protein